MTQGELLEKAKKLLEEVDIHHIDDIEVSVRKSDDGKQRVVIDVVHDDIN